MERPKRNLQGRLIPIRYPHNPITPASNRRAALVRCLQAIGGSDRLRSPKQRDVPAMAARDHNPFCLCSRSANLFLAASRFTLHG